MKRYLLFETKDVFMLLWVLEELNYKGHKTSEIVHLVALGSTKFKVLIDKKEKEYFCITDQKQLASIISGSVKVYKTNDTDTVLDFLEVNVSAKDITNYVEQMTRDGNDNIKLSEVSSYSSKDDKGIDVDEIMEHPLMKIFSSIIPADKVKEAILLAAEERKKDKPIEKEVDEDADFYQELVPGRIVQFENAGMIRYGIVLSNGTVMHFSGSNLAASGYINNITPERPYMVRRILKPTSTCFNLKDIESMEVAWEHRYKKPKTNMTIQDIEKQLGLEPGSLNIM